MRQAPEQISAGALLSREMGARRSKNKILVLDTPDDMVATPLGLANPRRGDRAGHRRI